jgi:hypothetical protein
MTYVNGSTPAGRALFRDMHAKYLRASGMALDGAPSTLDAAHGSKRVNLLHQWCTKNLTDEERIALCERLTGELENTPASRKQAHDAYRAPVLGYDSSHFYGKPRAQAAPQTKPTAAAAEFAARVKTDAIGQPPAKKGPQPNGNAVAGFNSRYPTARNIKVL